MWSLVWMVPGLMEGFIGSKREPLAQLVAHLPLDWMEV